MTIAVVTLAFALAVAVATAALCARWAMHASREAAAAGDRMREQARLDADQLARAIEERDTAVLQRDVATQALAAAKTRLAITETQRNRAALEERERVVQTIRDIADPAAAARLVNSILLQGPRLPKAGAASAADGDRRTAGVQAAVAPPAADQAGRVSKP